MGKILFKEFYDVEVKTTLLSHQPTDFSENILIVGDENYEKEIFLSGLSFAEEIIELINAPYVNFILAGTSNELVKKINSTFKKALESGHAEKIDHLFPTFPQTALDFITVNLQHLVFDFDEQDLEGIKQLLQMPYYHGLIKDIIEVKFV
jgi:hypothetical protein